MVYPPPDADNGIFKAQASGPWTALCFIVGGCAFHNLAPATLPFAINTGVLYSLTVGSVGGSGEILVPWGAVGEVPYALQVGATLTKNDQAKTGPVTAIYHDGGSPGNLVIEGDWSARPWPQRSGNGAGQSRSSTGAATLLSAGAFRSGVTLSG